MIRVALTSHHNPLTHQNLEAIRATRNRTILLFLTDRCPVGCAHCSVDSRADSATITDFGLFADIVTWITRQPNYDIVAISGGEPFVERRGLLLASERIAASGKSQVIFTSGVWAKSDKAPAWISTVLSRTDTVYLSTDGFHADQIDDAVFVRAIRQIVAAGCWLVIQFIQDAETEHHVRDLAHRALGDDIFDHLEFNRTVGLANGRGSSVFSGDATFAGHSLPSCHLARNPMVRYDGQFSVCCNESVLMGWGPARLRRIARTPTEMTAAIAGFQADPLIRTIGGAGVGSLTHHPAFADLADRRFRNSCDLCWKMIDRASRSGIPRNDDPLLNAIAELEVPTC